MEQVDTLIRAEWLVPVDGGADQWLADHAIAVRDGTIVDRLPGAEAERRYQAHSVHRLHGHALLPGLINAHTHAAMTLLRGFADDMPLMRWLTEHIWPAEGANVSPAFVQHGTELAVAEMLRGGITCFNDMYFFPEVTARVASRAGMRAVVGMIVIDFPTPYAETADDYFNKGLALHDAWRNDPLVHTLFAPHAPFTVGDERLERVRTLADELEVPVHIHVHETAAEVQQGLEQTGERPLARLDRLGLVSPGLIAVHMTQLTDSEIERIAEAGARVVHCPEANLKLASGFCPAARLLDAGIDMALGTDGAASNNDLDILGETRSAALLAKAVAEDASALPAARALELATLGGARTLGLDGQTGSIEVGKAADVIAIDLSAPETQPVYNPVSQLVYAASRDQVRHVWIAGRHLLNDRRLTTVDADAALQQAHHWRDTIQCQRGGRHTDS